MTSSNDKEKGNQQHETYSSTSIASSAGKEKDGGLWRDLAAFWILGLCNNYGYVVMLSAAHDIIGRFGGEHSTSTDAGAGRMCNIVSTGAILLADILPSLFIKLVGPFLPFFINVRVFSACLFQVAGFLMVAYAETEFEALTGVVLTSLSSGLGEQSFLSYSSQFNKNVISTWSSGTGGAGIIGALSYATLTSFGITPVNTMLIMLIVPFIEAGSFWIILRKPYQKDCTTDSRTTSMTASTAEIKDVQLTATAIAVSKSSDLDDMEKPLTGVASKIRYLPSLFKYMIPISLVYFLEYFINQGMFELVYFPNIWLDHKAQYRWLQVDYQIGVFISRSSVNLVTINRVWIMAVLQFFNVVYFFGEVVWFFTPSIWIVFAIVFWEGLLGGGAYVNTFYRMSKEVPIARRNFALGMVPIADAIGIAIAGVLAIPAHNAICLLPVPAAVQQSS